QVELAQLKYILPRLMGIGKSLSRLGAGIGTRGPGETKLETDRRHIRSHISKIQSQLKEVEKRRSYMRERRKKDGFQTVALVGYTNAGKSTLLNYLTDAGVLAEDKLFATLDPTARALTLPDGREVILIDTVGFIRKLPHHLVNAFKSTLEETQYASLILNVVDYSNEEYLEHLKVSENLLTELGCSDIPVLNVFNKCDRVDADTKTSGSNVYISAKDGTNMDELLRMICTHLPITKRRMNLLIPYAQAGLSAQLREDGVIINEEYAENGVKITADVEQKAVYKYEQYET
ncbi:MAG: GTPase HflX, partial [Ruminococcaceae bacterium]|nr:GTPase HflX [Oscillospiraceae bacterium]